MGVRAEVWLLLALCAAVDGGSFDDVTENDGYNIMSGAVTALGDYNSDHYLDLVVVSGRTVLVYDGQDLGGPPFANVSLDCTTCLGANVFAGDLNHDGLLDIVVQYSDADDAVTKLHNRGFLQMPDQDDLQVIHLPNTSDHFLAANVFGRMRIDMLATLKLENGDEAATLIENLGCSERNEPQGCRPYMRCIVAIAEWETDVPGCHQVTHNADLLGSIDVLSFVGDSSTVDLDGDCRADIVISHQTRAQRDASATAMQNRTLTVWMAQETGNPAVSAGKVLPIAPEVGYITFKDVDSDGDMDMIALFCDTSRNDFTCRSPGGAARYNTLMVARNTQPGRGCSGYHCCFSQSYDFPDLSTAEAILASSEVGLTLLSDGAWVEDFTWAASDFGGRWVYSSSLSLADYDNDRSVDVTTKVHVPQSDASADPIVRPALFHGQGDATFAEATGSLVSNLVAVNNAAGYSVQKTFFYDMHEEGFSDILVLVVKDGASVTTIKAFSNQLHLTTRLFFNAVGLNGRCMSDCSTSPKNPDPKPYGVNMPGVVHKMFFKVPDHMKSKNVYLIGTQLTSSSQMSLQLPYNSWGLGSINSYIEIYFCGAHVANVNKPYASWEALLPNSQVVVINYPMDHPSKWKIEQVVNPSKYTKWIALTTGVACIVLSIPILLLRCQELREDALERQKERPMMPL